MVDEIFIQFVRLRTVAGKERGGGEGRGVSLNHTEVEEGVGISKSESSRPNGFSEKQKWGRG